jgi:hypothetical protein
VLESGEAERGTLDSFDQVVRCLGGGVGQMGLVPGGDLMPPADDGPAESVYLGWAGRVL